MGLTLKFKYSGEKRTQFRRPSRIQIDGKGNLILYDEEDDTVRERLTLSKVVGLSISWGTTPVRVAHASKAG
jgi:hypothetical protein